MLTYIVRRLFQLIVVIFGVTIITLVIMFLIQGDPAQMLAGKSPTPGKIALIRSELGLDKPLYVQYAAVTTETRSGSKGSG